MPSHRELRILPYTFELFRYFTFLVFLIFCSCAPSIAFSEDKVVKILVDKSDRRMTLLNSEENTIKSYPIALGAEPVGKKEQEGDEKTPVGQYTITARNEKSRYHLSLRISYPDIQDIENAKKKKVSPGGDIMIHGLRNGLGWISDWHLLYDRWTDGCIAVTNQQMDEIWALVEIGTPIVIQE